jgi:hypothetical protein
MLKYNYRRPCHYRQKNTELKSKALVTGTWRRRLMKSKAMKRIGNIYDQITSLKNLQEADKSHRRESQNNYGVALHNQ